MCRRHHAILAALVLTTCFKSGWAGDSAPIPVIDDKPPRLFVRLRVPAEIEYARVYKVMRALKGQGAKRLTITASKRGEAMSADVEADRSAAPKEVAAVVEELLAQGFTKIAVEVKKQAGPGARPVQRTGSNEQR